MKFDVSPTYENQFKVDANCVDLHGFNDLVLMSQIVTSRPFESFLAGSLHQQEREMHYSFTRPTSIRIL